MCPHYPGVAVFITRVVDPCRMHVYYARMRKPEYDTQAPKQTVSLTLNSDLYAKAKRLGINASQVAEKAIADEYASLRTKQLRAELQKELEELDRYVEEHGCFSDMVRDHYGNDDGSV